MAVLHFASPDGAAKALFVWHAPSRLPTACLGSGCCPELFTQIPAVLAAGLVCHECVCVRVSEMAAGTLGAQLHTSAIVEGTVRVAANVASHCSVFLWPPAVLQAGVGDFGVAGGDDGGAATRRRAEPFLRTLGVLVSCVAAVPANLRLLRPCGKISKPSKRLPSFARVWSRLYRSAFLGTFHD